MSDAPVEKAVAANPAFVTLPDYKIDYPFGVKNVLVSDSMIKKWFNSGLAIFLGAYDTGPRTKPLSNGPMARAQGPNCLSRGRLLYNEAKEEWIATGEVWWAGNEEVPDWVANSQMGEGKCLCGHIVVYHFQIINKNFEYK